MVISLNILFDNTFILFNFMDNLYVVQVGSFTPIKLQIDKQNIKSMRITSKSQYSRQFHGLDESPKKRSLNSDSKIIDLNRSMDNKLSKTISGKHDHSFCQANAETFAKTASRLTNSNFSHHDNGSCICEDCQCGRHLCKLHVIKPDLTKNTIYKRSFYEQKPMPSVVHKQKQYDRFNGPHLDLGSTYGEGFKARIGDKLERPRPEDILHSNGPLASISSYNAQFPGHRGSNQYVKPTDKHTLAYFPLRSKSTYSKQYVKKDYSKEDYMIIPDQLKTGSNWFGRTTYGDTFNNANPEYFAKKVKVIQKKQENPDYNRQYETIYKNQFVPKKNPLCPAKVFLETKGQGSFKQSKHNFSENSDFKSLSPQFHAISTSKHCYV